MEAWPINIICYAPEDAHYEIAQQVLPCDRGFSTEMAWSDRFLGRLLNCHAFDVLVMVEPIRPSDLAFIWQARRHSRCNTNLPVVVMTQKLPRALGQMVAGRKLLSHIPIFAKPRMVEEGILNAVFSAEAVQAQSHAAHRAKSITVSQMPTALTSLFDGGKSEHGLAMQFA